MKLILEKNEIVLIIGRHFETNLDPNQVVIRTDPAFEIELTGLPLDVSDGRKETNLPRPPSNVVPLTTSNKADPEEEKILARADENATLDVPPPGLDGIEPTDDGEIHPAALLAKSKELAAEIDRDNPHLARQRIGGSSKPPTNFQDEI